MCRYGRIAKRILQVEESEAQRAGEAARAVKEANRPPLQRVQEALWQPQDCRQIAGRKMAGIYSHRKSVDEGNGVAVVHGEEVHSYDELEPQAPRL